MATAPPYSPRERKVIMGRIKAALRRGASFTGACGHGKVSLATGQRWRKKYEEFDWDCSIAETGYQMALESRAFAIAMDEDHPKSAQMLMFLLRCRAGYRDRELPEFMGNNSTVQIEYTKPGEPPKKVTVKGKDAAEDQSEEEVELNA